MTEYAVQVWGLDDDWMYVTEMSEGFNSDICVKVFGDSAEAEEHAEIWRLPEKPENVRVVKYDTNAS